MRNANELRLYLRQERERAAEKEQQERKHAEARQNEINDLYRLVLGEDDDT